VPRARKRGDVELFGEKNEAKLWHDCGPTLAAEELAADDGIEISRESLRIWLIEAMLRRAKRSRVERAHVRSPRRVRYGELVQWDTGEHRLTGRARGEVVLDIDDR
jgi:hypothetical protein